MGEPLASRTTQLPTFCSIFFSGEKCSISEIGRAPMTIWARPARIGATRVTMSPAKYWLSASVLTMTSAPACRQASMPVMKARASPRLAEWRTMWSTPWARATCAVASVEPSSITSHSTVSKPSTARGSAASVTGRCSSSFRHGIWMISFMGAP